VIASAECHKPVLTPRPPSFLPHRAPRATLNCRSHSAPLEWSSPRTLPPTAEERAAEAVAAGFPALLADSLRRHRWQEPAAEAGIRAVLAFGPLAAAPCTAAEVVQALLDVMRASDASHQIQSTGVRAIHCLTSQHAPALRAALEDGAVPIVRAAIDTNPEDGQLQWRGMNLLDALKPGQGEDVRKRALQRSFSSFLRRKDSKAQMGGSFV